MKAIFYVVLGIACLIFSYAMVQGGFVALVHDHEFELNSVRTTAIIKQMWINHTGRRSSKSCWVVLHYQPGSDGFRDATVRVSPPSYDEMRLDQQIGVRYLPDAEGDVQIDLPAEVEWRWLQDVGMVLAGVLIFVGTLFIGWVALPRSRQSWEDAAVKADLAGRDRFS